MSMVRPPLALALAVPLLACASEPEPEPEVPAIAYCEPVASWDAADAAFEREVVEHINAQRAKGVRCGNAGDFGPYPPLQMHPALRCAARMHTQAMIEADTFAATSPDGETYADRAALAEYAGEALAQTIAGGHRDPARVVASWMSNDQHCARLMLAEADEVGVGYRPAEGVTHAHYWTVVLGAE
jgi:uncharacterized protein YkwD